MDNSLAQFRNPSAEWRGKPFWSWNGELQKDELLRQIEIMQEMGLGGFFMHSRTGLITEYLGDDWFQLTNACADEAEKRGLEAWLYDEDRWPSGTAGGMVTADPAFRSHYMDLQTVPGSEFAWQNTLTAAFACRLEDLAFYECTRVFPETPPDSYQDKTVLAFSVKESDPSSFYNGYTYVDTLNPAATERYIQLTHEQYKKRCGDRLGTSIQGIFTDEPHRGPVFTGFSISNPERHWMTPWTDALPDRFAAQFGGDLLDNLPELFLLPEGRTVSPIKWQYMETLQQMFLDNFAAPLFDWCSANKMRLTGHVLHEDSLTAQAAMQGSLMRFYEYLHVPGIDLLSEGNRHFPIAKQLSSAARQNKQPWLLSELYGCTGWQMSFESHKRVGDWQALFGINLRCHHLSWYTMEGEAKRDYPGSILHQSAWYKDYGYVETYFARLGLLLSQGTPCCDILVLNPVESLWCQIHAGWAEGLSPKTSEVQALEDAYTELSYWLLNAHLDFDYGDEDMLARSGRVELGADGPVLHVGQAAYRVAVAGRMTTLRASTLRLLSEFAAAGGRVVFAGDPPRFVDALPSSAPAELAARVTHLPWEQEPLAAACRGLVRDDVQICDAATEKPLHPISCQMRREGNRRILVAMNMSDNQTFPAVRVRLRSQKEENGLAVEEWDCRTGARYQVEFETAGSNLTFLTDFAPSGERVFLVTPERDDTLAERPAYSPTSQVSAEGPFEFALGEENVCVLDFARHKIGEGGWQERTEILQVDRSVRRSLGLPLRSGEMVQPWFRRKHEPPPAALGVVTLEFEFDVDAVPEEPVYLCVERPELWQIMLNGENIPSQPQGWWIDIAFQKILLPPGALAAGGNVLTLTGNFRQDVNIEAAYLIGSFGVRVTGNRAALTRLPQRLEAGDLTAQGLPFYGGSLTYFVPVPASVPAPSQKQALSVTVPEFEAACVKVLSPDTAATLIAWPPYRAKLSAAAVQEGRIALEVVLTRRNTFGPLHLVPLRAGSYEPDSFITDGVAFTEDYQLYPAGLLQPPILSWSQGEEER